MVFYNTAESFCHQHPLDSTAVLADIDFVFAWVPSYFFPQPIRSDGKRNLQYRISSNGCTESDWLARLGIAYNEMSMYYIELEDLEQGAIAGRKDS